MKSFEIKTKIHFGDGALDRLKILPYKKVLVITDPFVTESGMIEHITRPLSESDIEYSLFNDVVPDPPIQKISVGVKKLTEYRPEAIIAIGGGSAMDSAKAIKQVALNAGACGNVPLIAIPTTSGTGSEVTAFAVITEPEANKKYPLVSYDMIPDEAILDAELVKSVPPSVTADTGMDVFTHALEAYVSINNNEFSAALSEKAIEICGAFLLRSYFSNEDNHARKKMHVASCLAGLAFNSASLGLNHGIAHAIGAKFHIPHGRANAMVLPHVIEFNSDINKHSKSKQQYLPAVRKYVNVAKLLGLTNFNEITTVRALVSWTEFMMKEMNMPLNIAQCGIEHDEYFDAIDQMAENAINDACTATNPRKPMKEDVIRILKNMYD